MGDALTRLAGRLRGELLLPNDHGYDDARRGYNRLHDRRPAVIVRPADAGDVARALELATGADLEVAVRGGGHSLAGYGTTEGGVLIDLSAMDAIHIDPAARVASVEAGTTTGRLTAAAAAHGLVIPFGDSPTVGVGGITLGGGVGWLSRKLGLTIDSVEGVELVTADGQLLSADARTRADLFWAVRGGGNFGVATRFRYRLHPIGTVLGGALLLPATHEVIGGVIGLADAAPDELTAIMLITGWGRCRSCRPKRTGGWRCSSPWSGAASPAPASGSSMPSERSRRRLRTTLVHDPTRACTSSSPKRPGRSPTSPTASPLTSWTTRRSGRSCGTWTSPACPPPRRSPRWSCGCSAVRSAGFRLTPPPLPIASGDCSARWSRPGSPRPTATATAGGCGHFRARSATSPRGAYLNFLDAADESRLYETYPDGTYRRLVEVKRRYDPTNLFHCNLNIRPVEASSQL